MSSNTREELNLYYDFYGVLLTDKQRDIFEAYYRDDYSLKEIAEEQDISRAAISDALKHARSELQQYEEKLHLVKNFKKRQILVKKIKSLTKNEKVLNLIEDIINTENEGGQNE